jgi:DNA polymerase (family X)
MVSNAAIAQLLQQYAGVIAAEGADRFKVKAYRRAAETVERSPEDVAALVKRGDNLQKLPGVGRAISSVIEEIVRSGKFERLDTAKDRLSPEMAELATRPLLDAKRVLRIYKKLHISSLMELKERLASGAIREGFGERVEMHVRQGLDPRPRLLYRKADQLARGIEEFLRAVPDVTDVARTGSLRRCQETVGDLSFLVSGGRAALVFDRCTQLGQREPGRGVRNRASYRIGPGHIVTVVWTSKRTWAKRLFNETGAPAHLRDFAKLRVSPLMPAERARSPQSETALYRSAGLDYIEPELREGRGEIEAARRGKLPKLVRLSDIQGDLHMHTIASDGGNSIEEMVEASRARGYRYIAITDHSQSLKLTNGLSEKRLLAQIRQIDKLNARLKDFVILKSSEVDILEDGSLDYPKSVLKELDLTICSIHSRFQLDRDRQTERILRAMENPHFNILGHATGRLLLSRPGYELDIERLVRHASALGCFFEINANPNRLDLSDIHARVAKDEGVRIAVNTDAHSIAELDFMQGGINQARRAWLERSDVLNAVPLNQLRKLLNRARRPA